MLFFQIKDLKVFLMKTSETEGALNKWHYFHCKDNINYSNAGAWQADASLHNSLTYKWTLRKINAQTNKKKVTIIWHYCNCPYKCYTSELLSNTVLTDFSYKAPIITNRGSPGSYKTYVICSSLMRSPFLIVTGGRSRSGSSKAGLIRHKLFSSLWLYVVTWKLKAFSMTSQRI